MLGRVGTKHLFDLHLSGIHVTHRSGWKSGEIFVSIERGRKMVRSSKICLVEKIERGESVLEGGEFREILSGCFTFYESKKMHKMSSKPIFDKKEYKILVWKSFPGGEKVQKIAETILNFSEIFFLMEKTRQDFYEKEIIFEKLKNDMILSVTLLIQLKFRILGSVCRSDFPHSFMGINDGTPSKNKDSHQDEAIFSTNSSNISLKEDDFLASSSNFDPFSKSKFSSSPEGFSSPSLLRSFSKSPPVKKSRRFSDSISPLKFTALLSPTTQDECVGGSDDGHALDSNLFPSLSQHPNQSLSNLRKSSFEETQTRIPRSGIEAYFS
eukprot:Sdes_comp9436_c0_seq1m900